MVEPAQRGKWPRLFPLRNERLRHRGIDPHLPAALIRLRAVPGVLGVALRSGKVRVYSAIAVQLVADWKRAWPFPTLRWLDHAWVAPDMEDVFKAYSQGYDEILEK